MATLAVTTKGRLGIQPLTECLSIGSALSRVYRVEGGLTVLRLFLHDFLKS
jgi:hypothetical protein